MKIIRRAGLKPWPKLFQNLRSTRQTELAEKHPLHVVCAWLGNKAAVAAEHYLQVTDADFSKAASEGPASAALALHAGNNSGQLETTDAAADCENTALNGEKSSPVVYLSPCGSGR